MQPEYEDFEEDTQATAPVLGYAGPSVPTRPAFNARRTWSFKGDHLFRVYLTPDQLWFIRIGAGQHSSAHVGAHLGLLGGIIVYFMQKHAKKKAAKKVIENEKLSLDQLIGAHKRNHVLAVADITDPVIERRGWGGTTKWKFNVAGEKKRITCSLETTDDTAAAIETLQVLFPTLRVGVQFDEKKRRYIKIK